MSSLPLESTIPEDLRLPSFGGSEAVLNNGERIRLSDPCLRGGVLFHTWTGPSIWGFQWNEGPTSGRKQILAKPDDWGFGTGIDTFNCVRLHSGIWLGLFQAQWCIGGAFTLHNSESLSIEDSWAHVGPVLGQDQPWTRQLAHNPHQKAISPGLWEPAPFRMGKHLGMVFAAQGPWASGLSDDQAHKQKVQDHTGSSETQGTCDRLGFAQSFHGYDLGRSWLMKADPIYLPPGRFETRDGLNISHPEVLPDPQGRGFHIFAAAGGHGNLDKKGIWHGVWTGIHEPIWWNDKNPIVPFPERDSAWHLGGPTARYLEDGRIELLLHGEKQGSEKRHLRIARQPAA